MSKLGTENKPAIARVQTEERAMEIYALCEQRGWQVIVGIEPDKNENIDDIKKLDKESQPMLKLNFLQSRNAPCPCGSGKQFKRCCGK
ncbi:MAG: PBPRA1643 family SWIM/SEC-C metal-binding motif protein [Ginsengibacter sp.]